MLLLLSALLLSAALASNVSVAGDINACFTPNEPEVIELYNVKPYDNIAEGVCESKELYNKGFRGDAFAWTANAAAVNIGDARALVDTAVVARVAIAIREAVLARGDDHLQRRGVPH